LAVLEIERNGRRLLNLVEDLLDLARQGSGPVEPVTVSGVLDEVIHILEPAARLRGISFDTTALTGLELAVEASRLRQVLHCVVANGLQALSAGGRIRIEPASTAGSRGVAMSLTGPNRIETDGLVTPLVLTLLADVGSIRVVTDDDDTAAGVVVEFAQDASP
jgi:signal transduction histidine kinase